MRTKIKKLTSVCLAVIMILGMLTVAPITAGAAEENAESVSAKSGDFEYELYDDILSITGYSGNAENLTIPSEIDGYTVTEIGWNAFSDNTSLTSITIPDTVTYIGDYALLNCKNLTSVTIPDSVTYIGDYAFENTALSSVNIPDSVTYVGRYAFAGTSITSVTVPASVTYIGENAFGYAYNEYGWDYIKTEGFTIYGYTYSDAEIYAEENGFKFVSLGEVSPFEYEVYDGDVASITDYNGSDANVTIPSTIDGYNVTEIGWSAFKNCTSLKSVEIPETVTYIGGSAFEDCTSLKSVTIPASVKYIGEHALGYVYDESEYDYVKDESFTIYGYTNSEAYAYARENDLKFVSLGEVSPFLYEAYDDVVSIIDYNGSEANLTIPSEIDGYTVTGIDWSAFENCTSLTSVEIPETVTYIGEYAFADCQNLKSVTIPASVTEIGEYAFGYVYDEDEWEYVKADGFTISGYKNSSADVYASDNGFKFVSLGEISPFIYELFEDGTVCITGYRGNSGYVSIPTMLDGHLVRQIGWGAFLDCPNVKSVEISSSVQYIADYAVGYIYSEDSWEYEKVDGFTIYGYTNSEAEVYAKDNGFKFVSLGTVSPYGYEVLEDGTASMTRYRGSETDLTIPSTIDGHKVTQIGDGAFYDNENLKSVTIPDSVTRIGRGAFALCTSLAEINIPGSVTYIGGEALDNTKWYENQPDGMVYAGNFAYAYKGEMPADTTITLKKGTKGIVGCAFSECEYLKGITIPDSVTFIGECSFDGCTSLESVTIPDSITVVDYAAFADCTKLKSVKISKNTTEIGWYAFCGCTSLKSVTVPADVEYIGLYAFGYVYDDVKVDGFTISGYSGSEAEIYANENGFKFINLSADPTQKLGDVNGDGSISIDDATAIQKYLANMIDFTDRQAEAADVNMDGDITIDDVTLVQKYLAGLAEI